ISSAATGDLVNTATITAPAGVTEVNTANNTSTDTDTQASRADLSVTKADSPDPVLAGNNITYTITVHNGGPSDALGVSLTDQVPANTSFVSTNSGGTNTAGTVSWSLGTIPAGTNAVVVLVVKVDPSDTADISNTASASSTTFDPDLTNNSATATTTVNTAADLTIAKDAPATATAGSGFDYSLTVTNTGPSVHT